MNPSGPTSWYVHAFSPFFPNSTKSILWLGAVLFAMLAHPAAAAIGDGHWDRQFAMPGTATRNFALRFNQDRLYTGGYSLAAGQVATNTAVNIFDGTNWTTLGDLKGGLAGIYDLVFMGSDLYVGGTFTGAGDVAASGLAKWDGASWSSVGDFSGAVFSLATDGTNLFAGGSFTNAGGIFATNVACWNGTNWSALGDGLGYYANFVFPSVNTLLWRDGWLYAGGAFTNSGGIPAANLARWDGDAWSEVGGGVQGTPGFLTGEPVSAIQFLNNDLYVGGNFAMVGGSVAAQNIAKWNGTTWSALGSGIKARPNSAPVRDLAFLGNDLIATGAFTNAGGVTARGVAKWDGDSWSSIGTLNGEGIRAVVHSGSVFLCGTFNLCDDVIGNNVIRYDGLHWHGIAGQPAHGTHTFVQALGLADDGLYMGGFFSAVGAIPASRVARWDGTGWHPLGEGLTAPFDGSLAVRAISGRGTEVFVGGDFSSAGGVLSSNIARWDGSEWSALAGGLDETVSAIEVTPTDVYAGGGFINAHLFPGFKIAVNRIARWDGSTWWPLGGGVDGSVTSLTAANGALYAGGNFTTAGGVPANRIARWDGLSWSSLGTGLSNGVDGTVSAILADGTDIYVGGSFGMAGGQTAPGIAKWDGSHWAPVGGGMFHSSTPAVRALAKIGGYIYATGTFTNAGGTTAARSIARWDGLRWEALGSGLGTLFSAIRGSTMLARERDLFIGGIFEDAGGVDSGYIARWNDQVDFSPPAMMRLIEPRMLSGNAFTFRATATDRAAYVIEYSADYEFWTPLATNCLPSLQVTDTAPGAPARSYRMRQIP